MNQSNFFELFDLPVQFAIDAEQLEKQWRALSAQVHPDRFATASPAEKRVAMQWATRINQAYQTLKNSVTRASYLCEQAGHGIQAETNTIMDPDFLFKQMQWHEALDEAGQDQEALKALLTTIKQEEKSIDAELTQAIDVDKNWERAVQKVREQMFIVKILNQIQAKLA